VPTRFIDREHAGRELAAALGDHVHDEDRPLVLALPRGGVPVAAEVAARIGGELDIVVARKIGAPGQPELGVGALAEDGPPVLDRRGMAGLGLTEADLAGTIRSERVEVQRRTRRYRDSRPAPRAGGRVVIVVDDGLATGATARAALRWLRGQRPRWLVLAVPTCAPQAAQDLAGEADEIVCLHSPPHFRAVGEQYADFRQLTDEDVDRVLAAVPGS
jgi:putative phosphoribosyl transferase